MGPNLVFDQRLVGALVVLGLRLPGGLPDAPPRAPPTFRQPAQRRRRPSTHRWAFRLVAWSGHGGPRGQPTGLDTV